ncbi:MAG: bifunctional hydroxymethylpyrimidine kinase/phosphomethylpyrimidine kinase [Bacteroidota bacterium]
MIYHGTVLTIAGSDSGGGAGIQADLKTISALGGFGTSALTALTAQNTLGVQGIHPVPPAFVGDQIESVLSDIGADAVKIGMLFSAEIIAVVAEKLKAYQPSYVVLDPVMVATSGDRLISEDAAAAMKELLFPLATVITPNLAEASVLINQRISTFEDMKVAAQKLGGMGPGAALVKGGHFEGDQSVDVLYENGDLMTFSAPRIDTPHSHGTGCTLSSAIATYLASGLELPHAVEQAKAYLTEALAHGKDLAIGEGRGPVHHFWNL